MPWYDQYKVKTPNTRPKDESFPQFKEDQPADKNFNKVSDDWRRGFGNDLCPQHRRRCRPPRTDQ
jgi:hypothetical protein